MRAALTINNVGECCLYYLLHEEFFRETDGFAAVADA